MSGKRREKMSTIGSRSEHNDGEELREKPWLHVK